MRTAPALSRAALARHFRLDVYLRTLPYFKPHWPRVLAALLLTVAASVLTLAVPWPLKFLVDSGLQGKPMPGWLQALPFVPSRGTGVIVLAVIALVCLKFALDLVGAADEYVTQQVDWATELRFKADVFNHLQRLSLTYHDHVPIGDSVYRVEEDSAFISTLVWTNFRQALTAALTFVGILYLLIRLDWQLALLALASVPISLLTIGLSSSRFRGLTRRIKALESRAQTIVQETLSGIRVVKAFNQESRHQRHFEERTGAAMRGRLRLLRKESLLWGGVGQLGHLNLAAIMLLGALHVEQGHLTIGELLVIVAYFDHLYWPLQSFGEVLGNMQLSLAGAERAIEVLDLPADVRDGPDATTLARVGGDVVAEGLWFAYPGGRPVLREVDFAVREGELVAVVGPTGAGKTTLTSLLLRLNEPTSGRILLDGRPLTELTVATVRESIALVTQEPMLFSASVRDNIAYGRPHADFAQIVAAAKAAHAHDFINALPEGYETMAGQRGAQLSAGERQRIAIARAFVKDAPILILDEPTAALDSRTEAVILAALKRLARGRTTFLITHRLLTASHADQILVLNDGAIVERGTHIDLLQGTGLYADLCRTQMGGPRLVEPESPRPAMTTVG